jgi:ElaB/YqjD/DUF883 family membrane-anchored ribosome-binding protein
MTVRFGGFEMADIKDRVKGAIDTGADKAKNLTDQAAREAKEAADRMNGPGGDRGIVDTVKDNAQSAMNAVGDFAHTARDRIGDYAGQVGDKVEHWADEAGHYAKDFGQEVTTLVRKYPVQSLLVGFGVGLLLGRVVRA